MGPFAMFDLSGIDVFQRIKQEHPTAFATRTNVIDRLCEQKRFGQKSGAGFYRYEKGSRDPLPDPTVEALFAEEAKAAGIAPCAIEDAEIVERLTHALINAGARLLGEGIALRPGDIDIVYIYGYGFPPHHGGPMWYADEVGLPVVLQHLQALRQRCGPHWEPAPLLTDLVRRGEKFSSAITAKKEFPHA
jgi:3-hydroxyacyl-CoA dehydrogenase